MNNKFRLHLLNKALSYISYSKNSVFTQAHSKKIQNMNRIYRSCAIEDVVIACHGLDSMKNDVARLDHFISRHSYKHLTELINHMADEIKKSVTQSTSLSLFRGGSTNE